MFCPKCRCEFVPGVTICGECNEPLVEILPPLPEPEYPELVTVYQVYGPNTIPVAESLLQSAKIPYEVQNIEAGTLFGTAGVAILVTPENVENARALLAELEEGEEGGSSVEESN